MSLQCIPYLIIINGFGMIETRVCRLKLLSSCISQILIAELVHLRFCFVHMLILDSDMSVEGLNT